MRAREHEPPAGAGKPESGPESGLVEMRAAQPRDTHPGDAVTHASEESFPASDAPPWTSEVTRGVPEPPEPDDAQEKDRVTVASEDSFPASDAPAWTSSTT